MHRRQRFAGKKLDTVNSNLRVSDKEIAHLSQNIFQSQRPGTLQVPFYKVKG